MTDASLALARERVRDALAAASRRLTATSDTPRLDAELLMARAMGADREAMLLGGLDAQVPASFNALIERRAAGEPVAYLTGTRDFWTIRLVVTPDVLIPRADTETLIEAAVVHFGEHAPRRILDLGTGSGALLLAALDQWPGATGLGIDVSAKALRVAHGNAEALGLGRRAAFRLGDWASGIDERFDLVLCNPPYVETGYLLPRDVAGFEPHDALFAGPDGLGCYRLLAPQVARLVEPGGLACFEIGHTQAGPAAAMFAASGIATSSVRDLAGQDRCLTFVG